MRIGYRSVDLLGNPTLEDSLRRELERQFPPDQFLMDIAIVGSPCTTYAMVRITNFTQGINLTGKAIPEEFGCDTVTAVIETVKRLVAELRESGLLPKAVI